MNRLLAFFVCVAGAFALAFHAGGVPSAEAQPADDWARVLDECVRDRQSLLALFLVDESGSLRTTDPEDRRVAGVQLGISSLANLVEQIQQTEGSPVRFEVSIVGFSSLGEERQPWDTADVALASTALSGMGERKDGQETDYANALIEALNSFAERSPELAAETGSEPCKILYWFTDGEFDIVPRPNDRVPDQMKAWAPDLDLSIASRDEVLARGRKVICERAPFVNIGVVDQLRRAGLITISLALTEQIEPEDERFLESIATNPPDNRCGDEESIGFAAQLSDNSALPCEFGTPLDGTKAYGTECERQLLDPTLRQTVHGDPGVDRAHYVVSASSREIRLRVRPPSGQFLELRDGEPAALAGAEITTVFTGPNVATVAIDFEPSSVAWHGDWTIEVEDPAGDRSAEVFRQLTYWGDYEPALRFVPDEIMLNDEGRAFVDVVTSAATPIDPSMFESFEVALVTDMDGVVFGRNGDDPISPFVVQTDGASVGLVPVEVVIRAQTRSGVLLEPVSGVGSFRIIPAPGYPTIATDPPTLFLDEITDDGSTPFRLDFDGPAMNDGCVWITGLNGRVLDGDGKEIERDGELFTLEGDLPRSQEDCLTVSPGERMGIEGEIRSQEPLRGSFDGSIAFELEARPDLALESGSVDVEFDVDVSADAERRNLLFAAFLAVGILFPLLVTTIIGWFGARFRSGGSLKHIVIPVYAGAAGLRAREGSTELELDRSAFEPGPDNADGAREFQVGNFSFACRRSMNPFAAPQGLVRGSTSTVLLSSGRSTSTSSRLAAAEALANLDVPEQWVLSVAISADRDTTMESFERNQLEAQLLVLVPFEDDHAAEALLVDANETAAQRMVQRLEAVDFAVEADVQTVAAESIAEPKPALPVDSPGAVEEPNANPWT